MFKKIIRQLDAHFEEYILGVLLIALTVVMLLQVVLRYVFNYALSWPEEFCRYCFIYMAFLSIGYTIQRKSMLKLDIVINALPKKVSHVFDLLIQLLCLAFYAYMFFYSFDLVSSVYKAGRTSPAMMIPFYLIYISTIVGFGLAVIRSVQQLVQTLFAKTGEEAAA